MNALEHDVFDLKEKGDKMTKENDELKKQIYSQKEFIQKFEQKAAENRKAIIEAKQEKLDKYLIVISPIQDDQFDLSLAKLSTAKKSRPIKNGKFYTPTTFKCQGCNGQYIGKSMRHLRTRCMEHGQPN